MSTATGTPAITSRWRWIRFLGTATFINEIIWYYTGKMADAFARMTFPSKARSIISYGQERASSDYTFHKQDESQRDASND